MKYIMIILIVLMTSACGSSDMPNFPMAKECSDRLTSFTFKGAQEAPFWIYSFGLTDDQVVKEDAYIFKVIGRCSRQCIGTTEKGEELFWGSTRAWNWNSLVNMKGEKTVKVNANSKNDIKINMILCRGIYEKAQDGRN